MRLYRIKGFCMVPHEMEMVLSAGDADEAKRRANASWILFLDHPSADEGRAENFEITSAEPYTKDK